MTAPATDAHQETCNAEKWERASGLEGRLISRFQARLLRQVRALAPESVLDAGCGEGIVTGWLAEALPGAAISGLELRDDAANEFAQRNRGIPIIRGDICAMPFDDGAFDVVLAVEVIEHLDRPRDAVRELARVARRAVVVTVPLEPGFRLGNMARGRHWARLGSTPGHQSTWGPLGFIRLVRSELPGARWVEMFPWQCAVAEVAQ